MKTILSNYNYTPEWLKDYTDDYFIFDRSDSKDYLEGFPQDRIEYVENKGTDIYDKFSWIIKNYENLPDVILLSKSNLFKYITTKEFDKVKDNTTFIPLLTQNHEEKPEVSFYKDNIYWEINNFWYLNAHLVKHDIPKLCELLGTWNMKHIPFAPGSNYILPKENILKHPKEFYEELRSYLEWDRYPGEAMIIERGLYTLWK